MRRLLLLTLACLAWATFGTARSASAAACSLADAGGIHCVEVVSGVSNGASPGVSTVSFGSSTTAGELIACEALTSQNSGNTAPTITDSGSQSYTSVLAASASFSWRFALYIAANSASGVTSVTLTDSTGNTHGGLICAHYTGLTTTPSDQNGGTPTVTTSSPWSSASVTTTQGTELLIGVVMGLNNTADANFTATGSWTQETQLLSSTGFDGGNGGGMAFADQIVTSTGSYANTGTDVTTVVNNYPGIATYKASGGGGSPHPPTLPLLGVGWPSVLAERRLR